MFSVMSCAARNLSSVTSDTEIKIYAFCRQARRIKMANTEIQCHPGGMGGSRERRDHDGLTALLLRRWRALLVVATGEI